MAEATGANPSRLPAHTVDLHLHRKEIISGVEQVVPALSTGCVPWSRGREHVFPHGDGARKMGQSGACGGRLKLSPCTAPVTVELDAVTFFGAAVGARPETLLRAIQYPKHTLLNQDTKRAPLGPSCPVLLTNYRRERRYKRQPTRQPLPLSTACYSASPSYRNPLRLWWVSSFLSSDY